MSKAIKFIVWLSAMKYNENITLIELENKEIMDSSNMVSIPKYYWYLFAGGSRTLSI